MDFNFLDKTGLIVIALILCLTGIIATFIFFENKQTNELIGKCVSETKNHLACERLYSRR